MSVQSIGEYPIIMKDSVENFHGNQVVYLYWYGHRVVSSPRAFPLPPEMPFGAIISDLIPVTYKVEPDYENLDFETLEVIWKLMEKSLNQIFQKV